MQYMKDKDLNDRRILKAQICKKICMKIKNDLSDALVQLKPIAVTIIETDVLNYFIDRKPIIKFTI